jgi:hypothetical protein
MNQIRYETYIYLNGTVHYRSQYPIGKFRAILGYSKQITNVSDLRNLMLAFMRKILQKDRLQCRWKSWNKGEDVS